MNLTDSQKLLRSYADHGDEAAFRKLVEGYIDLVYSTALRRVGGDSDLAQDVTQSVFTDLARKAPTLRDVEMLGGWLHRHTGFTASNMVRSEHRRQVREQEAVQMNAINDSPDALWEQLAPMLDDTIEALEPSDRQAVLLRFFEKRDFRAIGEALGISNDAAQKRVSRAVDKLRSLMAQRGVTLTAIILSSLLLGKTVTAAPAGLAATVSTAALAGAVTGNGMGLTLAKLTKSFAFKAALAGTVAIVALWIFQQNSLSSLDDMKLPPPPASTFTVTTKSSSATPTPAALAPAPSATSLNSVSNGLLLTVVAADSGKPVPDVQLDYWLWIKGNVKHKKPLMTTRFGLCTVPVPNGTTELLLVSEKDGFAETLLEWHTDRGETIPTQYTLKVARAASVGGTVVAPDGKPVAGAEVSFGNYADPAMQTRPQSDDFGWPYYVITTTDNQGHWQMNRIGKEALRTVGGTARHPNFVGARFRQNDSTVENQLLNGTYVFKLGHAVVVHGTVKDPNGNPVPDADVWVGHISMDTSRETRSLADGTFSATGCVPGRTAISVQAKGFAGATVKVNLDDNSAPFDIVLHPGKTLKVRVVDENGNPIPHTQVYYNTFSDNRYDPSDSEKYTVAQVEFRQKTDKEGRVIWDSAPDGDLAFDFTAAGYMRINNVKIPADGAEHVITLNRGLTIAGTVVDASTGRPIPRFRITTGWPNIDEINHTTNADWSTIDRFLLSFEGGQYQYTYDEQVINGVKNPAFIFKFKADGYAPFISRVVGAAEGFARLNVALTPAPSTEVTVLSANNLPVARADVGLVSAYSKLRLDPGGFSRQNIQSGDALLMTDDEGHFQLPPDDTITKVVVANPEGYTEVTPAQLAANPVITLLPWGQLAGIYTSNGEALADCTLSLQCSKDVSQDFRTMAFDSGFHVKTDSQGHFLFSQVPPGNHIVTFVDFYGGGGWSEINLQAVTIESGITTTVNLDRTNVYTPDLPNASNATSP